MQYFQFSEFTFQKFQILNIENINVIYNDNYNL
jgi:hypothetical protein